MSKIEEVRSAMVAAMKAKDKDTKETLSALLAALKNKAIDKRADLTEEEVNELTKLFVSPPLWDKTAGPVHTTGGAIDLTIVDKNGNELDMGTGFDCFKDTANTNYFELNNINEEVKNNRRLLYTVMTEAGFTNLPTEWWHFDYGNKFWAFYTKNDAIYDCVFDAEEIL